MSEDKCPVCGAPGKVVGDVTKHFERDEQCVSWPNSKEFSMAFNLESLDFDEDDTQGAAIWAYEWLRANVKIQSIEDYMKDQQCIEWPSKEEQENARWQALANVVHGRREASHTTSWDDACTWLTANARLRSVDERRADERVMTSFIEEAEDQNKVLREALEKLANEAGGFLRMANKADHGVTNMNVLEHWIVNAREALKTCGDL